MFDYTKLKQYNMMCANRTSLKHRWWPYQTYEQILGKKSNSSCLQFLYTFHLYIYPAFGLNCSSIHLVQKTRNFDKKVCRPSHLLQSHTQDLFDVTITGLHHRTYLKIDCLHRGPITHHDAMIGCGCERCCVINPELMNWGCWAVWDSKIMQNRCLWPMICNTTDCKSKWLCIKKGWCEHIIS